MIIKLEYADGGEVVFHRRDVVGLVKFNTKVNGSTYINVLLRNGHVVSVKAGFKKLLKQVWGYT